MSDCCPRCQSQQPHLHPAVQHGGEVQPCPDPFHRTITPQNTEARIAETDALLARFGSLSHATDERIPGVGVGPEVSHVIGPVTLDQPIVIPPAA